jgi:CHRD domain-containing protein
VTKEGATGKLAWRLTYSRLTGRAVAAHIHSGVRGKSGPVIVPLCSPCRNGARGTANMSAAVLSALEAGRAYVNIHTRKNAAGEVRGQIAALPLTVS